MKGRRVRGPAHHVVMLAYKQAQILDITGPLEVFSRTSRWLVDNGECATAPYSVEVIAPEAGPLATSSGIQVIATRSYRDVRRADTLLVTGGIGFDEATRDQELLAWITRMSKRVKRVGSICTGALVLAAAGLLKGRPATTHWAYCDRLGRAEPSAEVQPDAIYVRSGNLYTSAGVTAGIDMALAMVEEDWNRHIAIAVAQQLVMFLKRPGGQSQFSRILKTQAEEGGRFEPLQVWIQEHLDANLSIPALARRAAMSPRSFARHFADECGVTPGVYVAQVRIEAARRHMEDTTQPLKKIARNCGFGSVQTLQRKFVRALGATPEDYRTRFTSHFEQKRELATT